MYRKKKRNRLPVLFLLMLSLALGLLTGCTDVQEEADPETMSVSIIDYTGSEGTEGEAQQNGESSDHTGEQTDTQNTEDSGNQSGEEAEPEAETIRYYFRNQKLLSQHYEKHGIEMGFASEEEYEAAASAVITNPDALHKKEQEDNDQVYYVEETNEFAVLSDDGYIRTYFYPNAGINYYNRQ